MRCAGGSQPACCNRAVSSSVDVIFLALHGGSGENGTLQALLDLAGIPYIGQWRAGQRGCNGQGHRQALDARCGRADAAMAHGAVTPEDVETHIGWPAIVKPNKQGSTVGLTIVTRCGRAGSRRYELAFRHDDEVMIEQFIPGRELTVPVLGDEALPVGEIIVERRDLRLRDQVPARAWRRRFFRPT